MTDPNAAGLREFRERIEAVNARSGLNTFLGFEIIDVGNGTAELTMAWRPEAGQHHGFLHAGVLAALVDTACGYAAASLVGNVLTSHFSVNCLRPAVGERFVARAQVLKAGRVQAFVTCELRAMRGEEESLVATGDALLVPVLPGVPDRTAGRLD